MMCPLATKLIFEATFTIAEDRKWHLEHFCCWECDVDLCEKQYAKTAAGEPCCLPCFAEKHAIRCMTCKEAIPAGTHALKVHISVLSTWTYPPRCIVPCLPCATGAG